MKINTSKKKVKIKKEEGYIYIYICWTRPLSGPWMTEIITCPPRPQVFLRRNQHRSSRLMMAHSTVLQSPNEISTVRYRIMGTLTYQRLLPASWIGANTLWNIEKLIFELFPTRLSVTYFKLSLSLFPFTVQLCKSKVTEAALRFFE